MFRAARPGDLEGHLRQWCPRGDWVSVDDGVSRRSGRLTPGKLPSGGRSRRNGVGSPPHVPEVRSPGDVPLGGDLETVPLVESPIPSGHQIPAWRAALCRRAHYDDVRRGETPTDG
jgi:hypothetical protein